MILRTEVVDQVINGAKRATFIKDVVMTPGQPIGMVRKRRADLAAPHEAKPGEATTRGTVLLIHGFGQNRYTWHVSKRSFSSYLANLGWDVFNVDLRGHGRSLGFDGKRPEIIDEYIQEDLPACAAEAARLSGRKEVVLIGHSMGGLIAYCAGATKLRSHVKAIATIGSPYRFGVGSLRLKALSTALRAVRATGLFDNNPSLPLRFLGKHLQRRRAYWDSRAPKPVRPWRPGAIEDEILEEYCGLAFEHTHFGIGLDIIAGGDRIALHSGDGRIDYGHAFEFLNVPLMVIAGDADDIAPPGSVKAAYERSNSSDRTYRLFPLGHVDLVLGREAVTTVWPTISEWLDRRLPLEEPLPVQEQAQA